MKRGHWWFITRVEVDRNNTPVRIYHRNGGQWGGAGQRDSHKVSRVWTHRPNETERCEVCNPTLRAHRPRRQKPNALAELRALKEGQR